jgi:hypothetical protein
MIKKLKEFIFGEPQPICLGSVGVWNIQLPTQPICLGTIATNKPKFDYTIECSGDDITTYTVEFNTYGGIAEDIKVSVKLADGTYFEMPPLDNWPAGYMAAHIQEQVESFLRGEL